MTRHAWAAVLRWVGALAIGTIAVTRCLIAFVPNVVFDVDPLFAATPLAGFGPAGSLWLDAMLLGACGLAVLGETMRDHPPRWGLYFLALLPAPIIVWHGVIDAGDLWRGVSWLAAVVAGVTAHHLAQDRALRRLLVALLIGTLGPLLVRGVLNVTIEHAATVAEFETHKEQFFAQKGWSLDSANARIFERRLRQRQPTGWFATTNIFGTFVGFGVIALATLAAAARRRDRGGGTVLLFAAAAVMSGLFVWLTDSLGALGATALGGAVLVAAVKTRGWWRAKTGGFVALALIGFVLAGVVGRGGVLPEGFAGDRSLLFRWFYWQGAAAAFVEQPWTGVGPDGFQSAYLAHRPPRSPEEVTSAHAYLIDWPATLGIAGLAWVALALVMTWRIGLNLTRRPRPGQGEAWTPLVGPVLLSGVIAIGLGLIAEWTVVDDVVFLTRLIGLAAFVALAMSTVTVPTGAWRIGLAAGALVVLIHGNIDLTLTRSGAAAWAWLAIGLAAGPVAARGRPRTGWLCATVLCSLAALVLVAAAIPATRQRLAMVEAARELWLLAGPVATSPDQEIEARRQAAARLISAENLWPSQSDPRRFAAEQLERAANRAEGERSRDLLIAAASLLAPLVEDGDEAALVQAVFVHQRLIELGGGPRHATLALAAAETLAAHDPHGLDTWRRLADLQWAQGDRTAAAVTYQRVLEIDRNFELDPLKQLSAEMRAQVTARAGGSE